MVSVKVEDGDRPGHEAVTQLADAVQAPGPGYPPQPGLGVAGEVGEPSPELPAADVDDHVPLVSVILSNASEREMVLNNRRGRNYEADTYLLIDNILIIREPRNGYRHFFFSC